jgi:hypothetical protein
MRRLAAIALLLWSSTLCAQDQETPLKPGEGRETVAERCTVCHTAEIIVQSHMSRKTWETTLTWMEETQGLAPLEPEVRKVILDYLEVTQGVELDESDGTDSPWAYPSYRPNPLW